MRTACRPTDAGQTWSRGTIVVHNCGSSSTKKYVQDTAESIRTNTMAKLDRYLKQFATIIAVGIVALLAVNCILHRRPTLTNAAHDHTLLVTWERNTNDLATALSTLERPFTKGEHYLLAPELDQYIHYKNLNIITRFNASNNMRNVDISQYRHKVSLAKRDIRIAGLFLLVEQHKDRATSGGSCLYGISVSSNFRIVCSFRDFYNGTYILYCPPAPTKKAATNCCRVTVQLQCVNFSAYSSLYQALHKIIWTRRVCVNDAKKTTLRVLDWPLIRAMKRDVSRKNVVTWRFDKNRKWTARMHDGKWFRSFKKSHLCACVKSFGNIYLYGSSHMRYKFDYLVDKCYERPADLVKKHHDASVVNLHYTWNAFSDEFGRILSDRNRTLKENDLVFVQTGAHDLSTRGLAVTMSTGIRRFVESLAELEDVSQRKGFNVVVLTSPPSRDTDNRLKTKGGRNNFALAAFNEMIRLKAADMGVEVFDEFSTILPRQDSNRHCGTYNDANDDGQHMSHNVTLPAYNSYDIMI